MNDPYTTYWITTILLIALSIFIGFCVGYPIGKCIGYAKGLKSKAVEFFEYVMDEVDSDIEDDSDDVLDARRIA